MEMIVGFAIIFAFLTTISPVSDIPQDEVGIYSAVPGITQAEKFNVKPFAQFKDQNIIKQQYDYSCGSAALATLLNYYLGEDMSEQQVIQGLMDYGDARAIEERRAFSLLDMKQFVSVLGYQGMGYTAEIEDLRTLGKPCIVPIEFFGYKHFVVVKGIHAGHVFIADPYMGNTSFSIPNFQQMWYKNILFLVTSEGSTLNALRLKEEDLRLVAFDKVSDIAPEPVTPGVVSNERRFKETIGKPNNDAPGKYQFKTIGVK